MDDAERKTNEVICPECGHAFKSYMDRVLRNGDENHPGRKLECPVCGCGECRSGM